MRALSIRQPYAELILRGIKTAELRSISTTFVGERFYIYACRAKTAVGIGLYEALRRVIGR
jgi:predicted transcriptional regulator